MSVDQQTIDRARATDLVALVLCRGIELKKQGAEFTGLCPFHEDTTPSLSVNQDKGVYHCFGCGASGDPIAFLQEHAGLGFQEAVRELAGGSAGSGVAAASRASAPAQPADEWEIVAPVPSDAPKPPVGLGGVSVSARWSYLDAAGGLLFHVCRFERPGGKNIRPLSYWRNRETGELCWRWKSMPSPRPLFGLDMLAAHPKAQVVIVEGEKSADAAARLLAAKSPGNEKAIFVTWPGGANSLSKVDLEPLRGRKIVIWPDADEPGAKAADELCRRLGPVALQIKRLDPPAGMVAGWDAADAEADSEFDFGAFAKTVRLVSPELAQTGPAPAVEVSAKQFKVPGAVPVALPKKPKAKPAASDGDLSADDDEPLEPGAIHDENRRTIRVERNNVKGVNDEAETALLNACPFLYQRGGDIVRPMIATALDGRGGSFRTIKIRRLTRAALHEILDSAANWKKYDARSKKDVAIDAPMAAADALLNRGESKLRPLTAVIEAPTLRADGSILDLPGYDAETGLLYVPKGVYPPVPQEPTKEDAKQALKRLEAHIDLFPYVTAVDRSVALAAVLTGPVRRSLAKAPMFGMDATAAGSGKSMLVDYVCIIATGVPVPVFSQGSDEAETEKRLHGALLAGHPFVSFDNVTHPVEGNALCQAITQESMEVRPLGTSETRTVPTSTTFFTTGNGLVVREDMTRRVLVCQLDPAMERPELREFSFDPLKVAKEQRSRLLVDALTVLRAHHLARDGGTKSKRFNFNEWSAMVADALTWLGYADPAQAMDRTRANDPAKDEFRAVAREWRQSFGSRLVTVREAVDEALKMTVGGMAVQREFQNPDLREALLHVANAGGSINSRALGKWLLRHVKAVVDNVTVLKASGAQGVQRWGFGPPEVAADDGPPL
jgi:putative DNA primase/helicase